MKILIVGSKGFIGSHCVNYFSQNNEVWGCDIVMEYDNPKYIPIDSIDGDYLEMFQNYNFDICINCSGAANVPFSLSNPFNDFRLNTLNVYKILEAIRRYNSECKFITMSSAAVYGNPNKLPIQESDDVKPISPYGYHKAITEQICEEFSRFWGIKTCCMRIFSAYGPGLKKQLFWDMYHKFISQNMIELFGTGKESRDFIYISDIVQIIDLAICHSSFNCEIVNVANGDQKTIAYVAESFVKVLNSDKIVRFNNQERKADPLNWEANIDIIRSWGYERKVSLEQGIKNYIEWIKQERK
jgi:UDP-glucose 4-epimerase